MFWDDWLYWIDAFYVIWDEVQEEGFAVLQWKGRRRRSWSESGDLRLIIALAAQVLPSDEPTGAAANTLHRLCRALRVGWKLTLYRNSRQEGWRSGVHGGCLSSKF